MREIKLNSRDKAFQLELEAKQQGMIEVFIHDLCGSNTMKVASSFLAKGKHLLSLNAEKFRKGIFIYTINCNDLQIGFGRIVGNR